ncbi:MAG: hypothetical protein WCA20_35755 [Candidatus Sulfotelmatobacter sp.]
MPEHKSFMKESRAMMQEPLLLSKQLCPCYVILAVGIATQREIFLDRETIVIGTPCKSVVDQTARASTL